MRKRGRAALFWKEINVRTSTVKAENDDTLLVDNYFGLIKTLNREQKIQLAAKITHSIAQEINGGNNGPDTVDKFYGAWKSEKEADEIAAGIRADRTFTRNIERFS
jgi:hypothetical protein